jgi:hypothetical protein
MKFRSSQIKPMQKSSLPFAETLIAVTVTLSMILYIIHILLANDAALNHAFGTRRV